MAPLRSFLSGSVLVASVAGCGALHAPPTELPRSITVALANADDGRTLHAHVGDTFVIRLVVQMGTGYGWSVAKVPDALVLREGPEAEPADATQKEHARFRFEAVKRGGGALVLELRRPWEKTERPALFFRTNVVVD
jgi:predicted secreted protein